MKAKRIIGTLLSVTLLLTAAALPAAAAQKCPASVDYALGFNGVSEDLTSEAVKLGKSPVNVPEVTALEGYKFLGWSTTDPAKIQEGKTPKLVNPTEEKIEADTIFYAVYETEEGHTAVDHGHYVIGYPDGTFGPSDDITRGSVATIIARACLEGFVEGSDYGNPGNYSDVANDWAYSAISFCTINGVFKGYDDGTFRPAGVRHRHRPSGGHPEQPGDALLRRR